MLNLIIPLLKASLVALWGLALLGGLSLSPLPEQFQRYIIPFAGLVFTVHLIEYFVVKTKLKNKSNIEMNFVKTMLWGFGYWLPLFKKQEY